MNPFRSLLSFVLLMLIVSPSHGNHITGVTPEWVKVKGTLLDDKEKTLSNARIFCFTPDKKGMYIGGFPPIRVLAKEADYAATVNENGDFLLKLDATKSYYIFFTADGKKTNNTYLPSLKKSAAKMNSVEINAILYDTAFIRDENIPSITSNDKTVNLFIKAQTLSNLSNHTDVLAQMDSVQRYRRKYGTQEGFIFDLSNYYQSMIAIYAATNDRDLKNYVLLNLSFLSVGNKYPVEEKYVKEAVTQTMPSDPVWLAEGGAFVRGVYFGLGGFKKNKTLLLPLMEELVNQCPVEAEKPAQLYSLLYYAHSDEMPETLKYYARLLNDYPASTQAEAAKKRFAKVIQIETGKELPFFSLKNVDDTTVRVTNKTAKGKIRIIDFWATWCGPCIAQLPHLDSIYTKYKNKGLEIITISLDSEIESILRFRKLKYPMPWINGFAGKDNKKITDDFEIFGIPKTVLVDQNGIILTANQNQLWGANLELTLQQYLK